MVASNCNDGNFWYFCATEAGSGIPAQLEVVAISAKQARRYSLHPMIYAASDRLSLIRDGNAAKRNWPACQPAASAPKRTREGRPALASTQEANQARQRARRRSLVEVSCLGGRRTILKPSFRIIVRAGRLLLRGFDCE